MIYIKPVELEIAQEIIRIIGRYPLELQVFTKDLRIYAGKGFRLKKFKNALMRRYLSAAGCYNYIRDFVFAPVINAGNLENLLKIMEEPRQIGRKWHS